MKQKNDNHEECFAALDIGSSKVLCLVAKQGSRPNTLRVMGIGDAPSRGVKYGCIDNLGEAVKSIQNAVDIAGYTANVRITGVWAAIGGQWLRSVNCIGQTVLRGREVTSDDVQQAENNARQAARQALPDETSEFIKIIPQGYRCGDVMLDQPLGLVGPKLEAFVHAIYGTRSTAQNLKHSIERAGGVELFDYEPHPWAAARGALSMTERECGVALIDIGAQTTSLIVFRDNRILFSNVRPWGADTITRDIAIVLGIDLKDAEDLKQRWGECRPSEVAPGETVQIETTSDYSRSYGRELLVKTIASRMYEMFELYRRILVEAKALDQIEAIVLTGGGAKLKGIAEMASSIFGRTVRVGCPRDIEGDTLLSQRPDAVVATGLAFCALDRSVKGAERVYGARRGRTFRDRLKTFFIGDY